MIHRITRHAAQHIWQQTMASARPHRGLLISTGDCITHALYPFESLDAGRIPEGMTETGQALCGLFYHELPEVAAVLEYENMLDALDGVRLTPSLLHVHLDFHAAGLLKMAAYTLVNHRLIPLTLTMVD